MPSDRRSPSDGNDREPAAGDGGHPTDAGNLLLLAPGPSDAPSTVCRETLDELGPSQTNLLVVSYNQPPDRWLADWKRRSGGVPAEFGFVHVGGVTRSAAATSGDAGVPSPVQTVQNPNDLTGLGITLTRYLESWGDDATLVCFESITTLLQYVDLKTAYRFLHVLTSRTGRNGVGVYHLDPGAHDDRTVNTLQSLFDAVERVDA